MATDIYLGPSGSETLLPPINWLQSPPELTATLRKNVESETMLGGKVRYNLKSYSQRSWTLSWALLTKDQVDALQALADLRQTLRFNSGATALKAWRTVAVTSFVSSPVVETFRLGIVSKYRATMTLEESNG